MSKTLTRNVAINGRFLTQSMSGVQRVASEIAIRLANRIKGLRILCPPGPIKLASVAGNLPVEIVGSCTGHLWEQFSLPRALSRLGHPILLNITGLSPIFYSRKALWIHDASLFDHPEWFGWSYRLYYNTFLPLAARRAAAVLTVSDFSRERLVAHFPWIDPIVIHSGVQTPPPTVTAGPPEILFALGSLDARKNQEVLPRILAHLDRKVKLRITGAAPGHLKSKIDLLDSRLEYTGYVRDEQLEQYFQEASIFIAPSLYEGFDLPPLEAMARGIPVIASDIPVHREILGNAAVLVDSRQPEEFARAIRDLLDNPSKMKSLSLQGRKRAREFSWDYAVDRILDMLDGWNFEPGEKAELP